MNFHLQCLFCILTKSEHYRLLDTASLIANSEFPYYKTTSIIWRQADMDLVTRFISLYHGSVETIHMEENKNLSLNMQQSILFVTSSNEFVELVANLDKNISSPSKVVTVATNPILDLNNITKIAWKYDITDLIILIPNGNQSAMYTYYPYRNNECGNTSPLKADFKKTFFPSKYKNLFGCEIRLGTWGPYPPHFKVDCVNGSSPFLKGLFGDLFMMITEHMNATVKVLCVKKKDIFSLNEKKIHVLAPIILGPMYPEFQNTGVFYFFKFVWCGPPRREIYTHVKVLVPFMSGLTILLFITFVALVVLLKFISKVKLIYKKSSRQAWNTLAIILGQPADFETNSCLINFLFALWIWFNMVVTIAYNGLLVKGLQSKIMEPRFDTIENAVNLVDGYGGMDWQVNWYNGTPIWKKYQPLSTISTLPHVSNGKRYLILAEKLTLLGYNLQILEHIANTEPITSLMTARWGGGIEIRNTQTKLIEAGFFQKFVRDEELAITKREALAKNDSSESSAGHLDMVNLSSCFYGIGIMWFVCCVVLLLEIIHYWHKTPTIKGQFKVRRIDKATHRRIVKREKLI